MKKRLSLIFFSLLFFISGFAYADEGFIPISPAQPTQTGDKIEVLEVFWYACPHCYDFEPYVKKWLETKADDVEFRRMPGIFRKSWIPHAKAYFTAQKLGILDTTHSQLFDAIHKEKQKIFDDDSIKKFYVDHGVDGDEFSKVYDSDEIDTKIKQAFVMGQRYKVTGVPSIIVNGKYLVSGSTAGSFPNMLKIVDSLVDKERASTAKE